MDEFFDHTRVTQEAILERLASVGPPELQLQKLQSSLGVIRRCYREKQPPPFSEAYVRAAYALGYFPVWCKYSNEPYVVIKQD